MQNIISVKFSKGNYITQNGHRFVTTQKGHIYRNEEKTKAIRTKKNQTICMD